MGCGPTEVVLKQAGPWTVGALVNHLWSFAGDNDRKGISATFAQPFFSHTSKSAFTYGASLDFTYDWKAEKVTMPVAITVSQLTKVGKQLVSFGGGLRYQAVTVDGGPHGIAGRVSMVLLFPIGK